MRFPFAAAFALVAASVLPRSAGAAHGENSITLSPSYAAITLNLDQETTLHGGFLDVIYQRGIGDTWWARLDLGGGAFAGPDGLTRAAFGTLGVSYAIDILKYVPSFNVGIGAVLLSGGGIDTTVRLHVELGFDFDILHSRSFSYGLALRLDSFASETLIFSVGPRLSWRWGYF